MLMKKLTLALALGASAIHLGQEDLLALGLWGVPSMQVQDVAVWGQDRLWAIEDKLRAGHPGNLERTP